MNDLFASIGTTSKLVECLGKSFPSDTARREHYGKLLAEKLKDPEFRRTEGFPDATDQAILDLSDPPYYTACPNPFLSEFINHFLTNDKESKTALPYAGDLAAESRHPVYSFHPYHTKVPPEIIRKLIEHYTRPGEIVLDAFCGTGMTGVAARESGRTGVVIDLSPIAAFIASVNGTTNPATSAALALNKIISESKKELGWVYETEESGRRYEVNYFVWADVFTCPECVFEFPFFPHGVVHHGNKVETRKSFACPSCAADLNVRRVARVITSSGKKKALVWTNAGTGRTRINREANAFDQKVLEKIASLGQSKWNPVDAIDPNGYSAKLAQLGDKGISDVSRFLSDRNCLVFADLWDRVSKLQDASIRNVSRACLTSIFTVVSERQGYFGGGGGMSGNLYMPIVRMEKNVYDSLERKIKKMIDSEAAKPSRGVACAVSAQSSTNLSAIPNNSIDYIYTDPPFGANIIYSEMNLMLEGWLKVRSTEKQEAVINEVRDKGFDDYGRLMRRVFNEYFRVLKPGRWITVEFHNTMASVWNLIQTNLAESGFIVAQVGKLDKGSTTILADIRPGAVVQDLIISAYKPNEGLEEKFQLTGGSPDTAWAFVDSHLQHLPISNVKGGELIYISERSSRIIYDRMVGWFIKHGSMVPLSSQEFQAGMRQRFVERDEMFFLPSQLSHYEKERSRFQQQPQIELFVSDERSAIDWLSDYLKKRPSTYREIHPEFVSQLGAGWKKHENKPELQDLLEANFLRFDGDGEVPSQIHSYLSSNHKDVRGLDKVSPALVSKAKDRWYVPDPNKAQDLEKKREKALLKEFEDYQASTSRKLKGIRLEVLRAGFKAAWAAKDYKAIIAIAQKIPEEALQEDEKLLLWYDQALTRMEADA
jgi:16S rRNA G966 N2-methylase RsmD